MKFIDGPEANSDAQLSSSDSAQTKRLELNITLLENQQSVTNTMKCNETYEVTKQSTNHRLAHRPNRNKSDENDSRGGDSGHFRTIMMA